MKREPKMPRSMRMKPAAARSFTTQSNGTREMASITMPSSSRAAAIPLLPLGPELAGLCQRQQAPRYQAYAEYQPGCLTAIEIDPSVGGKPDHQRAQQQKDELRQ